MEQQKPACTCGSCEATRVIYACSGIGSNVGQLANAAACQLAFEGFGSGSCLAGVGGNVDKLIGVGKAADERIVIDGCPVACAKKIMDTQGLPIDRYVMITELGIAKTPGPEFAKSDVQVVLDAIKSVSG